jgi:hypothetical protein
VYEAVCGSVLGCEYGCVEGIGETEGIETHVYEKIVWVVRGRRCFDGRVERLVE